MIVGRPGNPPGPPPPGPVVAFKVTGIVAEARPDEVTFNRAVHELVAFGAVAVTVTVAGVVAAFGVTERKLPHVDSETATANGDDPAVLRILIVCVSPVAAPGTCPSPPPPKFENVSEAGDATIDGLAVTIRLTGTASGLFVVPAAAMLIEPVWVPAGSVGALTPQCATHRTV